ncbi:MAG: type II/IV secretion system ATPase subunit [Candidatus Thermoplasmatota archaeon]|nr:type II/IV secretion system ATPase subunit [Candidatus Thermoplasmatota archaeon]MBS3789988.1 type II/IV secretion system ATPase subunit [Candidatus Thermoplasmatota archaeon]
MAMSIGERLKDIVSGQEGPQKVKIPSSESSGPEFSEEITPVPKIADKNVKEIEINAVDEPYTYVRIKYDNTSNEYIYEVIEPPLTEDEEEILEIVEDQITDRVELIELDGDEEEEEYLEHKVKNILQDLDLQLKPTSRERVMYYVKRNFLGYGPVDVMMKDPDPEDISCDGVGIPIYVFHRKYGSMKSNVKFEDGDELDNYVIWLAQRSGKHISVADPMLDATMPDGSRLQETLGTHITQKGSSFTIRRFEEEPYTPINLIKFKTFNPEMMAYAWIAIENGQSMLICGGTASGKTTTLNAILLFIPSQDKIVSIEDTRELNLPHDNWVPLLTRSGFGEIDEDTGQRAGEIDMYELLQAALRQRPQYMMVGEVRGEEAYVVFQAMATGKSAYTTFHSEDVQTMVNRMENDPINLPRALVGALDAVVMQAKVKVGTKMVRRIKNITEIVGVDPDTDELITNKAYTWNPADDSYNYGGHSYIYEKVAQSKNWTQRQMEKEVKRRKMVLDYLEKEEIFNYKDFAQVISSYYRDKEAVLEKVRKRLGEDKKEQFSYE